MASAHISSHSSAPDAHLRIIENPRDPIARRIVDVLRSASRNPRTILIEDEANVGQAIRSGIELLAVYATVDQAQTATRIHQLAPASQAYLLTRDVHHAVLGRGKASNFFALARTPRPPSWQDIARAPGDLVVLDGVRIPGNIGAVLRSTYALGAAGIVLVNCGLTSIYDRRLIRASRGLSFAVPVIIAGHTDLTKFLEAEEIPLAGLSPDADSSLQLISRKKGRIAILLGSEVRGASAELVAQTQYRFSIPMRSGIDSLNVSVAAGIALYERSKRYGF